MTKDKKGITLVSLVVTIIIMMLIFGVTITTGTKLIENARKTKIETVLYMVKARAEALLEQYLFDEDVRSLIGFSVLEKEDNNNKTVVGYNYHDIQAGIKFFNYKIKLSGNITKNIKLKNDSDFLNWVKFIYPELFNNGVYKELIKVNKDNESYNVSRCLFVKWGEKECISHGIYDVDDDDKIVSDDDYIIVVYDLKTGAVDVAYSTGYRSNDRIAYKLKDIIEIDNE